MWSLVVDGPTPQACITCVLVHSNIYWIQLCLFSSHHHTFSNVTPPPSSKCPKETARIGTLINFKMLPMKTCILWKYGTLKVRFYLWTINIFYSIVTYGWLYIMVFQMKKMKVAYHGSMWVFAFIPLKPDSSQRKTNKVHVLKSVVEFIILELQSWMVFFW